MSVSKEPDEAPNDSSSLLSRRPYLLFLAGRFLGTVATGSQAVVIAWEVYACARRSMSLAEASFVVGMIGLAQFYRSLPSRFLPAKLPTDTTAAGSSCLVIYSNF